jgi:hypothetical protein
MHEPTKALDNKTKSHQCKTGTGPSEQRLSAAIPLDRLVQTLKCLALEELRRTIRGVHLWLRSYKSRHSRHRFREPMRRVTSSRPGLAVALLVLGLLEFA